MSKAEGGEVFPMLKGAHYRHKKSGYVRTLSSWGEKNVRLGLGTKAIGDMRITREEFEREWELVDPTPYYEAT
jgi:hypothetical protein